MKYLFILGRNPELSLAEIQSFIEKEGNEILSFEEKDNSLFVDLKEELVDDAVDKLGGTVSLGKVICEIDKMEEAVIYNGEKNNINYIVWDFSPRTDEVSDYLKKRFRSEKMKAAQKVFTGQITLQSGEVMPKVGSRVDRTYFVFGNYFGEITQDSDYKALENRDMNKPVRRESLSISPRLAKIMLNLSQVPYEGQIVDPFCGIGVILQEALLQGVNVIGVDKDGEAIKGAKQNFNWFNFDKKNYELHNLDSTEVNIPKVNAMVSEPDLGTVLKRMPPEEVAKKTLKEFERLMIEVINNLQDKISGRIVFTAPLIRNNKKRLSCNYERILERTGLSLVEGFPIQEYKENQIVGRDIFVFEKQ